MNYTPLSLIDSTMLWLLGGIAAFLIVASVIGAVLKARTGGNPTVSNLNERIAAWWIMCGGLAAAIFIGETAVVLLFLVISLLALREFLTILPTTRADHRTLLFVVYVIPLLNFWFVWEHWYGAFSVLIPVYAFLFLPAHNAIMGDTTDFLRRSAVIQWALMVCVYAMSFIPMIMTLPIAIEHGRAYTEGSAPGSGGADGALLMLFLVLVVQLSDVFQYVFGKLFGKRKIVPTVSPNKTWEGFIGGVATATLAGAALFWITPFTWWQAGLLAFVSCILGFAGGLVMSSIKRDRGIKDFGALLPGHGGIMDRFDSLVFAAPVFFHLVRFFFTGV